MKVRTSARNECAGEEYESNQLVVERKKEGKPVGGEGREGKPGNQNQRASIGI